MICEIRQGTTPDRTFVMLQGDGTPAPTTNADKVYMTMLDADDNDRVLFRDREITSLGAGTITNEAGETESFASGVCKWTPQAADTVKYGKRHFYLKSLGESYPTNGYGTINIVKG